MANEALNRDSDLDDPIWRAVAVTPNDSADLATVATRALYIGGAGDVKVTMSGGGSAVTFAGLIAGTMLPVRVDRVHATDTTATSIVACY